MNLSKILIPQGKSFLYAFRDNEDSGEIEFINGAFFRFWGETTQDVEETRELDFGLSLCDRVDSLSHEGRAIKVNKFSLNHIAMENLRKKGLMRFLPEKDKVLICDNEYFCSNVTVGIIDSKIEYSDLSFKEKLNLGEEYYKVFISSEGVVMIRKEYK